MIARTADRLMLIVAVAMFSLLTGLPAFTQPGAGIGVDNPPSSVVDFEVTGDLTVGGEITSTATDPTDAIILANAGEVRALNTGAALRHLISLWNDDIVYVGSASQPLRLDGTTINGSGVDLTPETGTYTQNYTTACTTTPSATNTYARIGNVVTLAIGAISCTSDSSNFLGDADMPTSIRPASNQTMTCYGQDNGTNDLARLRVNTAGTLTMTLGVTGTTWTSSGTKALGTCTVSYLLN